MNARFVDIHAHLQLPDFDEGRAEAIARMREKAVTAIVVGIDANTSRQAANLAEKNEHIFASVGLHPNEALSEEFDEEFYRGLLSRDKVVAVGECGLDYFRTEDTDANKKKQLDVFRRHIGLALEFDKPLMIHCRPSAGGSDAYEDLLHILSEHKKIHKETLRGNIHFFAGNEDTAKKFLGLGFTLSFTGVITFTHDYDKAIICTPADMIMSETDCPFVAPVPYRGKRNEPSYVPAVVKRIAELKDLRTEEMQRIISNTARRMFGI